MKKLFIFSALLLSISIISCNKGASGSTGPIGNPIFKNIEIQDKYIVVNFEKSGFTGSKIEFRASGVTTENTANAGKDTKVQITSPNQKVSVNPGSGYNIQIVNLTSGTEEILYEQQNITTYLFYDDFKASEALPANANQSENTTPWKNKWVATWKGPADWNHAMNGSFRNIELKKEGNIDFIRLNAKKTGESDDTSIGSGIQTAHLYVEKASPIGNGKQRKEPFFFTYGKVEIVARLDKNNINKDGPFPALWLLSARGSDTENPQWRKWPMGGEIDIMEHVKSAYGKIITTVHFGSVENKDESAGNGGRNFTKALEAGQWIKYTLNWTKEGLYFYVNDQEVHKYLRENRPINQYPFTENSAYYLIMNVGIGREGFEFTGEKAPAGLTTYMDVDYVKVIPNKDTILDNSRGPNGCEYYRDVQW